MNLSQLLSAAVDGRDSSEISGFHVRLWSACVPAGPEFPRVYAQLRFIANQVIDSNEQREAKSQMVQAMHEFIKALAFAAEKHRNQRRKDADASPYINHPIALVNVLASEGEIEDPAVLCAAVLHDTLEDTKTIAEELSKRFGDKVAAIVLEVTDDKLLKKEVRKQLQVEHAPHLSPEAKLVKLADKICNLRDILASPPAKWSPERKRAYFDWAANVVAGVRGVAPRLEAVFDRLFERRVELGEQIAEAGIDVA